MHWNICATVLQRTLSSEVLRLEVPKPVLKQDDGVLHTCTEIIFLSIDNFILEVRSVFKAPRTYNLMGNN